MTDEKRNYDGQIIELSSKMDLLNLRLEIFEKKLDIVKTLEADVAGIKRFYYRATGFLLCAIILSGGANAWMINILGKLTL